MDAAPKTMDPQDPTTKDPTTTEPQVTTPASPPQPTPETGEGTLSGAPLRDAGGDSPRAEGASSVDAVQAAATGTQLNAPEQSKALQWFLKATPDRGEAETKVLKLNFGTEAEPEWIHWTIAPVSLDRMRSIRQKASNSREARKTGQVDEYRVNLEIVVAGTRDPNIAEAARILQQAGALQTNDPAAALRIRFQAKPGYIAQISSEIMSLSGFNDDDVTEVEAVEAAGNS